MHAASAKDCHGLRGVSGARHRSGGVEKYNSIASRQAPEHGSTASSLGPDSGISAAVFSAQLMQAPARSIPQPVQLQLDLWDVSPRLSLITPPRWQRRGARSIVLGERNAPSQTGGPADKHSAATSHTLTPCQAYPPGGCRVVARASKLLAPSAVIVVQQLAAIL